MPEILFFLPCEKAYVDIDTNALALIGLMDQALPIERRTVDSPDEPGKELRVFFVSPFYIVTLWRRSNISEKGWDIEQSIEMISPDGKKTEVSSPFKIKLSRRHNRVIQVTPPLLVRVTGEYKLILKYRIQDGEWNQDTHYSFFLNDFPEVKANEPPLQEAVEQLEQN